MRRCRSYLTKSYCRRPRRSMKIRDWAFTTPDIHSKCFDRKMLGWLCLRIKQAVWEKDEVDKWFWYGGGHWETGSRRCIPGLQVHLLFDFSRCDFYSLPCSSSCSLASSSLDTSFVGHPITKPSLSDSDGLGMTWKWTWSTTLVCNRVSVRALGEEENTWWAIRPLFCKIL